MLCARFYWPCSQAFIGKHETSRAKQANKSKNTNGNKSDSFARVDFILMIAEVFFPRSAVRISSGQRMRLIPQLQQHRQPNENIYLRFHFLFCSVFYRLPSRYQRWAVCTFCRIWSSARELSRWLAGTLEQRLIRHRIGSLARARFFHPFSRSRQSLDIMWFANTAYLSLRLGAFNAIAFPFRTPPPFTNAMRFVRFQ